MNKFFSDLTKRNWGAPWHIIIADALQVFFVLVFTLLFTWVGIDKYFPFARVVFVAAGIVMLIGYLYEAKQSKQDWDAKSEFLEDMIANFSGVVLGSLKVWGAVSV